MNLPLADSEDEESNRQSSYSGSTTSNNENKDICFDEFSKNEELLLNKTKNLKSKIEINTTSFKTGNIYNESRNKDPGSECNGEKFVHQEIGVKIKVGSECISLCLGEDMEIKDVIDILSDMYGLIDSHLGLEMNGIFLQPDMSLKLFKQKSIEMKLVFHVADEMTSLICDKIAQTECTERTFKECCNVSVQTKSRNPLCCRETQTPHFPLIDMTTNTPHNKSIQTGAFSCSTDKALIPKQYISHDVLVKYQNEQAVMIQKCVRRFLAQKRFIKIKKERDIALLKQRLQTEEIPYIKLLDNIQSIMNKRAILLRDDFTKAHALLYDWIKKEKIKIREEKFGNEKRTALNSLFTKELECLQYIQKCRMMGKNENDEKSKLQILNAMSKPYKLKFSGYEFNRQKEDIVKASIFKNIFSNLMRRDLKNHERVDFLCNLKIFLRNLGAPECTQDMMVLIDREIQMINLRIKSSSLEGLRKRLQNQFLHLSIMPEFNPASKYFQKQKDNESLFQCRNCKELKPPEKFNIHLLKGLTHCTECTIRKEIAHSNKVLTSYKQMIQEIYNNEMKLGSNEKFVNLLQSSGLHYLVESIWLGRSCLSEENDLELLKFVRWDKKLPWSPWNCILLTRSEADLHNEVEDIYSFYGDHYIRKIENRHLQAKIKFAVLDELNEMMKNSQRCLPPSKPAITKKPKSSSPFRNAQNKKLGSNHILNEPISDLVYGRSDDY